MSHRTIVKFLQENCFSSSNSSPCFLNFWNGHENHGTCYRPIETLTMKCMKRVPRMYRRPRSYSRGEGDTSLGLPGAPHQNQIGVSDSNPLELSSNIINTHQSWITNHQSVINHLWSIINHESSIIPHQSSIINRLSSVINHQSSIIYRQS